MRANAVAVFLIHNQPSRSMVRKVVSSEDPTAQPSGSKTSLCTLSLGIGDSCSVGAGPLALQCTNDLAHLAEFTWVNGAEMGGGGGGPIFGKQHPPKRTPLPRRPVCKQLSHSLGHFRAYFVMMYIASVLHRGLVD